MWGQHYASGGDAGEPPDLEPARQLLALSERWDRTFDTEERRAIWQEMLDIHAEYQFGIGILSEAPQPVVVNDTLRNVPERAIWAFEPGAHFGIHRIDEFYFDKPFEQVSR
jgi:peptide/nickel transport system substrate-binding protein